MEIGHLLFLFIVIFRVALWIATIITSISTFIRMMREERCPSAKGNSNIFVEFKDEVGHHYGSIDYKDTYKLLSLSKDISNAGL